MIAVAPCGLAIGVNARRYHRKTGESAAKNTLAPRGGAWLVTRAHWAGVCSVVAGSVQKSSAVRAHGA